MPSYQKDVWNQTKQQDPKEYENTLAGAQGYAKTLSKSFGGGAPISPVSYAQQAEGQRKFNQGDVARREKASGFQQQMGAGIDNRRTQIADQVTALLNKDRQFTNQLTDQQANTNRESDLAFAQVEQENKEKMGQLNFSAYKNGAQRADALAEAYEKGYAELALLDAATEGKLKVQDINNYFNDLIADMRNSFSTWQNDKKIETMKIKARFERMSKNGAAITDGLVGLAKTGFDVWGNK